MKKIFFVLLCVSQILFFSCSSDENENKSEIVGTETKKIDWQKPEVKDKVMRVIDKHYIDNSFRKGMLSLGYLDRIANKRLQLSLQKIEQDSIYPIDGKRVFMKVILRNTADKDSSRVEMDYEVEEKRTSSPSTTDSVYYEIVSLNLRKVGQEQRYTLKKEGNFWVKEILAVAQ